MEPQRDSREGSNIATSRSVDPQNCPKFLQGPWRLRIEGCGCYFGVLGAW